MHNARALCGFAVFAAALGSSLGASAQTIVGHGGAIRSVGSKELIAGTFACTLGPITHQHDADLAAAAAIQGSPQRGSAERSSMAQRSPRGLFSAGFTAERCITAAEAAHVSVSSLANFDSTAIGEVSRLLDERLAAEGVSAPESNGARALFRKGVSAAWEARESSDIAAHHHLADLYRFGRNLGMSDTGAEAQSLAWVIGINRFLSIQDMPAQLRPPIAEPFFAAILDVTAPPPSAGSTTATWNEYLAAAARAVGPGSQPAQGAKAIGGGPAGTTEEANLREVARASEERLQALKRGLSSSPDLRAEVDRTVAKLKGFELQAHP
jgi:hypothetical protein